MKNRRDSEVDFLKKASLETGKILMSYFRRSDFNVSEKSPGNPVSDADFAADRYLKDQITRFFPSDAILSEEAETEKERKERNSERKNANRVWIIDPLDGTKNFLNGNEEFSVSIGLIEEGKPVLGGVYNPAREHFVYGGIDTGIYVNGKEISNSIPVPAEWSKVRLVISNTEFKKNIFHDIMNAPSRPGWQSIGSVAWKLSLTSAGEFDLLLSRKPKSDWDVAAGMALFQSRNYQLYNQKFEPVTLNRENTTIDGLIGGSPSAIDLYRSFLNDSGSD